MSQQKRIGCKSAEKSDCVQVSLRPYPGCLFLAKTRKAYERESEALFNDKNLLTCDTGGRTYIGRSKYSSWTFLVWAQDVNDWAHEFSHVILDVFQNVGIDPREANGEPFCYMMSHLMAEAVRHKIIPAIAKKPQRKKSA